MEGYTKHCIVPREMPTRAEDRLRQHLAEQGIETLSERRRGERRSNAERRQREGDPPGGGERRLVHSPSGRRQGERRAELVAIEAPELPRWAKRHDGELRFVERIEPDPLAVEDADTARLVVALQSGDREIFGTIYSRYLDRVYNHMRLLLGGHEDAEDTTQDVFISALEALPAFELRGAPVRTWLFRVARNKAIDRLRELERVDLEDPHELNELIDAVLAGEPSEPIALSWLVDTDLLALINRLPLAQRQVLVLRHLGGFGNAEIAVMLDRTPQAVSKLHQRATAFLRERLTAMGRSPQTLEPRSGMRAQIKPSRVIRERRWILS